MKKKTIILLVALSIILIGLLVTLAFIPNNPIFDLFGDLSGGNECKHTFDKYTLSGTPTYDTAVTAERTCTLCHKTETETVYAAKGLTYETDDEGMTAIVGAEGFTGNVLYLCAKQPNGEPVHYISDDLFFESNLALVIIEEGFLKVGNNAFSHSPALQEIYLPASVTEYGSYTFAGCSSLTDVHIAKGATVLGRQQFYECKALTEIVLPEGIADIPAGTFYGCSALTYVSLPSTLANIGTEAFISCQSLKTIVFPENLKEIYPSSFAGCSGLESIILPALDKLHHSAFMACTSLKTVFLSGGIKKIEVNSADSPFVYCSKDLVLYTDAAEQPSGWDKHFENYNSNLTDEDGGELSDDSYYNLKVVYGCSKSDFPG